MVIMRVTPNKITAIVGLKDAITMAVRNPRDMN
jgi:hypothetical protein